MQYHFVIITDHGVVNGGLANVAINQAIGLAKAGYKVLFISGSQEIAPELVNSNIATEIIGSGDFISYKRKISGMIQGLFCTKVFFNFKNVLRRYDLSSATFFVHGWSKCLSPSVFYALRGVSAKVYLWNHDYFLMCPNGGFFNYKSRRPCDLNPGSWQCLVSDCDSRNYIIKLFRFIRYKILGLAKISGYAAGYVAIGERNKAIVDKYCEPGKSILIGNFVDLPEKPEFHSFDGAENIVVVGRPSPEKGLDELFGCLRSLGIRRPVTVVGARKSDYDEKSTAGLSVQFTGWVSPQQVKEILATSRYLIFPSLWVEGSPLVVQEAIACGLPVMCAENNSGCEMVIQYEAGVIYNPYSLESFRQAIQSMEDIDKLKSFSKSALSRFWQSPPTMEKHLSNLGGLLK